MHLQLQGVRQGARRLLKGQCFADGALARLSKLPVYTVSVSYGLLLLFVLGIP
jgi:hypothetical protein